MNKSVSMIIGKGYQYCRSPHVSRAFQQCVRNASATATVSSIPVERTKFTESLTSVIDTLMSTPRFQELPEVIPWVKDILDYNMTGGKLNRGLTTVFAYKMFEKPENITDDTLRAAHAMGWCVEMLQSYLVMLDDIMDGSTTRRGAPCWYRRPDVGLAAINDALLVQSSLNVILKTHFERQTYYVHVLELFTDSLLQTIFGQHLDLSMAHRNRNDYAKFTPERYEKIVKYKTAFYSYKLPVCLGLYLSGVTDAAAHARVEDIALDIGVLFQMQDDFIDCYSDESTSGKVGTDIQEGKCSWLAVSALQHCSAAQRVVFEACYASSEPAHIERIKQLYLTLQLPQLYAREEERRHALVSAKIAKLPESLAPQLFGKLLDMIRHRKK